MDYLTKIKFNKAAPKMLHIDLNSCFATVEQQANPRLRGKPIAVAAYKTSGGFILAPSVEAKALGIKMGMRVKDGKNIYPGLIVLEPDPWKYRNVHLALKKLLLSYTSNVWPKSIDEFVLDFRGATQYENDVMTAGRDIKRRIKEEVGDWLTVSVGIAPNRFLAKTASNLHKPDGLDVIDHTNYLNIFSKLHLADLCGIKTRSVVRLNAAHIYSVLDFFNAPPIALQNAFHAVTGYYWHLRLRGWEIDDVVQKRGSYSNSVALGQNFSTAEEIAPVLIKLVEKVAIRMRSRGYWAHGVHLWLSYKTGDSWHKGKTLKESIFSSRDIYRIAYKLLLDSPRKNPVHIIAVTCFDLSREKIQQLRILDDINKEISLTAAVDSLNQKWGNFVVAPAKMLDIPNIVKDRIAFGGVKELEEIVL